jgi:hypothetical protein
MTTSTTSTTTRILTSTVALVLVLGATNVAHAGDESGSFGLGDFCTLALQGGAMHTDTVLPDPAASGAVAPAQLDGFLGLMRLNLGGYMRRTRFDSFAGIEFSMGLGWLDKPAVAKYDEHLEGSTWGRLFLDMDTGLTVLLLERFGFMGAFHIRASVQGGVGFNNDFDYVYTGARVATSLFGSMAAEASYQFRWGTSYAGGDAAEHRVTGTLVLSKDWGLGAELWSGDQTRTADPMMTGMPSEQPTPYRAFKGTYQLLLLSINLRWQ